jgi:hypothetical protein
VRSLHEVRMGDHTDRALTSLTLEIESAVDPA